MHSKQRLFILRPPLGALPGGRAVKNPAAKREARVQSLGREDPLEKEMATRSRILAQEIPQTEEPGGLQSTGSQRVRHDLVSKQQQETLVVKKEKRRNRKTNKLLTTNNISLTNGRDFSRRAGKTFLPR